MTHRRYLDPSEKPKLRKSIFDAPQITHKLIKNTSYADIKFSDDDDPELIKGFRIGTSLAGGGGVVKKSLNVYDIPISHRTEKRLVCNSQNPPPPLIEARILASSLVPELDAIRKPTYADASRQSITSSMVGAGAGHVLGGGGCAVSSMSSSAASTSAASVNGYNWLRNIRANDWSTNARSILVQEKESDNRDKYQQLLEQVVPRIYGVENAAPQLSKDGGVSIRRSALLVAAAVGGTSRQLRSSPDISAIATRTCNKIRQEATYASARFGSDVKNKKNHDDQELPYVEPVKEKWLENWKLKCNKRKEARSLEVIKTEKVAEKQAAERRAAEVELHDRPRKFQIVDPEILVIGDFPEPIIDEAPEFIELIADHQALIKSAICGPPNQVLVSKFNLNIIRRDMHTLLGHNWLNDEVINFYMNLLTERGEKQSEGSLPSVYAMYTFFVPRLMQAGHAGVKRWTRKVDIFAKDILPVPVHVGGVHWCMAIIHMCNRTIKYYDSMGTPNPSVLKALEQYLKDESMDKRKQPFDTSRFEIESVRDVPRQMNGSDCGVFSCMFAEYITRNHEITFSQQNMEYFRHKMMLEIVRGELLH